MLTSMTSDWTPCSNSIQQDSFIESPLKQASRVTYDTLAHHSAIQTGEWHHKAKSPSPDRDSAKAASVQVKWAARAASPQLVNNRFFDGRHGAEPPVEVRCIVSPHADRNAPRGT